MIHWSGAWSGPGASELALVGEDGEPEAITADDWVTLIAGASGFVPRLVYLSAGQSAALGQARDWDALRAAVWAQAGEDTRGSGQGAVARPDGDGDGDGEAAGVACDRSGDTGVALALVASGVPQVVAMRFDVRQPYATELACRFYERVLAGPGRLSTDSALALARDDVQRAAAPGGALADRVHAVDHANAMLIGHGGRAVERPVVAGRAAGADERLVLVAGADASSAVRRHARCDGSVTGACPGSGSDFGSRGRGTDDGPAAGRAARCRPGERGARSRGRGETVPVYAFHELERERARAWMDAHPDERANALGDVGPIDASRVAHLRSAEAHANAGSPRAHVLWHELAALGISVKQGMAEAAMPAIEAGVAEARALWQRHLAGELVTEAPDDNASEGLGRLLVSSLQVAADANAALERWEECLALWAEVEQVSRARGESEHFLACILFRQHGPLLRLGRLDDAQRMLEGCLDAFRAANDLVMQGKTLSALADMWSERHDLDQAIAFERKALSVKNRLSEPGSRSISHNNLANYLMRSDRLTDAMPHRFAAVIYAQVSGHREHLANWLRNLVQDLRVVHQHSQANPDAPPLALPRLAALLAMPAFEPLARFLASRGYDNDEARAKLQAQLDDFEAQARQAAGLTPEDA